MTASRQISESCEVSLEPGVSPVLVGVITALTVITTLVTGLVVMTMMKFTCNARNDANSISLSLNAKPDGDIPAVLLTTRRESQRDRVRLYD